MNILLLTTHLEIGGIPVYTVNLARALARRGAQVFVASGPGALVSGVENEKRITFLKLNLRTKKEFSLKVLISVFDVIGIIKRFKIDVIHAQTRVSQVVACAASRFTGVPFVVTCHGFFKHKRLGRRLFPCWGDRTIGISEAVCRELTDDFSVPRDRVRLVYNGVDFERFSARIREQENKDLKLDLGIGEKDFVLGAIGRLSPVKGLKYLILAMKDILKEHPFSCLLLVGEGPSRKELVDLSRNLEIEKNVIFARSTMDTRKFLSIMDIFAFPSIEEGLGISLLEALATGRACVATDVGGISSIIKNEITGLLVPPQDSHALKDAILRLFAKEDLRTRLGRNGKDLVQERFSLDEMAEKTLKVYQEAKNVKLKA